jgi:hypothetical protein
MVYKYMLFMIKIAPRLSGQQRSAADLPIHLQPLVVFFIRICPSWP